MFKFTVSLSSFSLILGGLCLSLNASASTPAMSCDGLSFAGYDACQDYTGSSYNPTLFDPDHDNIYTCSVLGATGGSPAIGFYCDQTGKVGTCQTGAGTATEKNLHFYTGVAGALSGACAGYLQGTWIPAGEIDTDVDTDTEPEPEPDTLPAQAKTALVSDGAVTVSPNACTPADVEALVAATGAITFTPTTGASEGIVIYPGGNVDPRAYAVAARRLAEEGFFVAIIPFAGNLAITAPMRGLGITMAHPEISVWAVAGHSLGGVAASIWAFANPMGKLKGIAFWASYPAPAMGPGTVAADLSLTTLKAVSVTGTLDTVLNQTYYNYTKSLLPAATRFASIRGGNHAQFGYYGAQSGDGTAQIGAALQHELFVGATIQMMNRIGLSDDSVDPIYADVSTDYAAVCQQAQKMVGHFTGRDLKVSDINSTYYPLEGDFTSSKPSFPTDGVGLVSVTAHAHQAANANDVDAPVLMDGEVWCKMKTQEAMVAKYGFAPAGAELACGQVNEDLFAQAEDLVASVDPELFDAYVASGIYLQFAADYAAQSGPDWLSNEVELTAISGADYSLESSTMHTPLFVPAPYGGVFYCKLWTLESAVQFIAKAALGTL